MYVSVNHMIKEFSRKAWKDYTWERNVIYRELCKWLRFDYSTKWYQHKYQSKKMRRIKFCGILTDKEITESGPDDIELIKKTRICHPEDFALLVGQEVRIKENEKRQINVSCKGVKNVKETVGEGDKNCYWCSKNVTWKLGEKTEEIKPVDHTDCRIVEISKNTQKSTGVLAVTQTSVRDHVRNHREKITRWIIIIVIIIIVQIREEIYYLLPCIYHIYQPLRSGRIWHKVNF